MIERLVGFALKAPFIVLMMVTVIVVGGLISYENLNVEAYPNPVPPLVEVITQPDGWSAEEVERQVTIPLEIGLAGMPGLDHVRSQSIFGLSDIKCYFNWDTDYGAARQEVINRLQFVSLPPGIQGQLSPWNAIGELYRYTVEGDGYSLMDRKTIEDWVLERQWRQVPGVIDVTSYGGLTRQYQVAVDPFRLTGQGVTLGQLEASIQNANQNVGGQRVTIGEQAFNVRGLGLIRNVHDVDDVVVAAQHGTPVRVRDVAETRVGNAPRLGIVGRDDDPDVVQGIVLMRYGGQTEPTLRGIHQRVEHIENEHVLPPGMHIRPYYDRGNLVEVTMHTVMENVGVGIALVTFVLFLFLGHLRAALITALTIPLALFCAFCGLVGTHTSANLISLGAIDFGIVVDSTVIMIENIFRHLGPHGRGTMKDRVMAAAREVAVPMTFATAIIAVSFLPLFTLTGVSGVIFAPMARTYAFAIGGAVILALTLTPVLAARFIHADEEEKESWLVLFLHKLYAPFFDAALRRPRWALVFCAIPILLCVVLFPLLGREFMPKLEEGNLWIRVTLPMSISLEQSSSYVGQMRRIIRGCPTNRALPCDHARQRHPEVLSVVSQLGRPDDGTDVTGFNNVEFFAPLIQLDHFRSGYTKDDLINDITRELQTAYPGAVFNFSQMISDNVEEALSGIKGENSVRVFGPDLVANEHTAEQVMAVMSHIHGIEDLGMFRSLGQPNVQITPDRAACARYGLNTGDVTNVVQAAVGGAAITQVLEGDRRFDLTVRWQGRYRQSIDEIRNIRVSTPDGAQVPLAQIADVSLVNGPSTIYREDHSRFAPVKFSVRGRDLASTVDEAQRRIARAVHFSYNQRLEWSGQINELHDAESRLMLIVPLTFALIGLLVYFAVKNWVDVIIVVINIPVACTGGVLALLVTGVHFSVSAAMGFISIFGIAIQDAILVVTYFQRLVEVEGHGLERAAREAAEKRFRPVLMTTLVACLGLLPAALAKGVGAQTQRPLAIVVIGGSIILAVLTRVLQPPLLVLAHEWIARHRGAPQPPSGDSPEESIA